MDVRDLELDVDRIKYDLQNQIWRMQDTITALLTRVKDLETNLARAGIQS